MTIIVFVGFCIKNDKIRIFKNLSFIKFGKQFSKRKRIVIAKIYPNPTTDQFNIEMKNFEFGKWTAELFSIEGKSISKKEFSNQNGMMETSAVIPGIYFLRVTTTNGIYASKVVKK